MPGLRGGLAAAGRAPAVFARPAGGAASLAGGAGATAARGGEDAVQGGAADLHRPRHHRGRPPAAPGHRHARDVSALQRRLPLRQQVNPIPTVCKQNS